MFSCVRSRILVWDENIGITHFSPVIPVSAVLSSTIVYYTEIGQLFSSSMLLLSLAICTSVPMKCEKRSLSHCLPWRQQHGWTCFKRLWNVCPYETLNEQESCLGLVHSSFRVSVWVGERGFAVHCILKDLHRVLCYCLLTKQSTRTCRGMNLFAQVKMK